MEYRRLKVSMPSTRNRFDLNTDGLHFRRQLPRDRFLLSRDCSAYLLIATGSRTPIAGTVLPTTAAIWRTCVINSSNWSG